MSDMNKLYRFFREEVRDAPEALAFYRKFRETKDKMIKDSVDKADKFLDDFKNLSIEQQIELFEKLYEFLFK